VLLRLAYLGVTNALAMLRLLPMSDLAKDAEILALRHQVTVLERGLQGARARGSPLLIGPSSRLCCTGSRGTCCAGSGCPSAQKPCAAGTAT
jgi:hypothetical protein